VGEGRAISVNRFMVGIDRGVPVGSGPGAPDVDDAVTTVVGVLLGVLLVPMRARRLVMMLLITAKRSVEPEPAGVPV
jgi:hypothetical protein